jgi:hypothetical protein
MNHETLQLSILVFILCLLAFYVGKISVMHSLLKTGKDMFKNFKEDEKDILKELPMDEQDLKLFNNLKAMREQIVEASNKTEDLKKELWELIEKKYSLKGKTLRYDEDKRVIQILKDKPNPIIKLNL